MRNLAKGININEILAKGRQETDEEDNDKDDDDDDDKRDVDDCTDLEVST